MDCDTFLTLHKALCDEARELSARKGHDYSGTADTLANLKRTAALGITTAPLGVLVRIGDKVSRLTALLQSDGQPQVGDERIRDTVLDLLNYSILFYALLVDAAPPVKGRVGWTAGMGPYPIKAGGVCDEP